MKFCPPLSLNPGPRPGELDLSIATPFEDDRAIAVTIGGTVSAVAASAGLELRALGEYTASLEVRR